MLPVGEKRRHPRIAPRGISAHLCVANRASPCAIADLSAGGAFVASDEVLPTGIRVALSLARPGWTRAVQLPGRVIAAAQGPVAPIGRRGLRISFDPLEPEASVRLSGLLAELGGPAPDMGRASGLPPERAGIRPMPVAGVPTGQTAVGPSRARPEPRPTPVAAGAPESSAWRWAPADRPVDGVSPDERAHLEEALRDKDRQLSELRRLLAEKEEQLVRVEHERTCAEAALQRLTLRLASRK